MAAASAAAEADRVFTWEELVEIAGCEPLQAWSANSHALKFGRWVSEEPAGVVKGSGILPLPLDRLVLIGQIEHAEKGPGFTFTSPAVAGQYVKWSAAQFITQLRPDALKALGIVGLGVKQLDLVAYPNVVDKMRLTAARQGGQQFAEGIRPVVWDFVLTRGDGVTFALHPSWKGHTCKVSPMTEEDTQRRLEASNATKVRAWDLSCYPLQLHGLYQEGKDLQRDLHRQNHLQSQRRQHQGTPAVAGQSPDGGPASASPAPAAEPTSSSSASPALGRGESWYQGYRVKRDPTTWFWLYWTGTEWKRW